MDMSNVGQRFRQAFQRIFHERATEGSKCGGKLVQSLEKLHHEFCSGSGGNKEKNAFGKLVAASLENTGGNKAVQSHDVVKSVLDAIKGLQLHPRSVAAVRGLLEGYRLCAPPLAPVSEEERIDLLDSLHDIIRAGDGEHAASLCLERNLTDQFRLATQSLTIFPTLRQLPVDEDLLRRVLANLLAHKLFSPALKLYALFGQHFRRDDFTLITATLLGAKEYERMLVSFQCVLSHVSSREGDFTFVQAVAEEAVRKIAAEPLEMTTVSLQVGLKLCDDLQLGKELRKEVSALLTTHKISQFCSKNKWQIAAQLCRSNKAMQAELFRQLVARHHFFQAQCIYDEFNLGATAGSDLAAITPEQLHAQTLFESEHYLQFPLDPGEDIILVDSMSGVEQLAAALGLDFDEGLSIQVKAKPEGLRWIGVDAEWRAEIGPQTSEGASLLQLCTADKVFLLDLVSLSSSPSTRTAVVEILTLVFSSRAYAVVGWAFSESDLSMLRQSAGGAFHAAFANLVPVLELNRVVASMVQVGEEGGEQKNGKRNLSLSDACLLILGRPLNKAEQTSDWRCPLRPRQLLYAALDAHALLGIADVLLLAADVPGVAGPFTTCSPYSTNRPPVQISSTREPLLEKWLHSRNLFLEA